MARLRVPFMLLVLISAIYLITRKNDEKKLLGWATIILFMIFNPLVVDILVNKFGLENRIERFMWYLPFIVISIVAIIDFIDEYKNIWIGVVGTIVIVIFMLPIGLHTIEVQKDDWNDLYCMSETELEIARILEGENNKEPFTVWSDQINLLFLRQYLPNIKNIYIDFYLVAEDMTMADIYGEYSTYMENISNFDINSLIISKELYALSLKGMEVKYFILKEDSDYYFLLEYNECSLLDSVNGYNIYRIEDTNY